MKLDYLPHTDSLYFDLSEEPSKESQELSGGIVYYYKTAGNLAGIDIDKISQNVRLKELKLSKLPTEVQTIEA